MRNYILDGHDPVAEPDIVTWDKWFAENTDARRVARSELAAGGHVSTVFLGRDHQFGNGPPLLFESMLFAHGDNEEEDCDRYSTWAEADKGHAAMVAKWDTA